MQSEVKNGLQRGYNRMKGIRAGEILKFVEMSYGNKYFAHALSTILFQN